MIAAISTAASTTPINPAASTSNVIPRPFPAVVRSNGWARQWFRANGPARAMVTELRVFVRGEGWCTRQDSNL
jgi:hypothetical protein